MTKHSWSVEWCVGTTISEELAAFIFRALKALKMKAASRLLDIRYMI
jgi:hypothetical protein